MQITKEVIDLILAIVPEGAKACYTGQSILAYCPNPTFTWEEVNAWTESTDIDIFVYSQTAHAAIVQAYLSAGWQEKDDINVFKANRIRFWNPNKKFNLQTVSLVKEGYPELNISWAFGVEDSLDCIKRFDMDYLMVSMDLRTKVFADLRPENKRVANVNPYHARFDPMETEPSFWYRQFERCPKGWNRGIDTRPVAKQYKAWIEETLRIGDKGINSKSRQYRDREMQRAIAPVIATGITQEQAQALWHMFRGEDNTWESQEIKHKEMLDLINAWLASVED